ncbi:hypothetical protein TYRP_020575 [Tyrophagus putrescentiae]|nr:hypothetical protein TYRP_020575 [Tyrophagus putrescentiae]
MLGMIMMLMIAPQAVHCTKILSSSSTFAAPESGTFEGFNIDNYDEEEEDEDDNDDHQENEDHTLHPSFYELLQKHNTFRYLEQQKYMNQSSRTKTEIGYPKITTENEYSSYRDDGWTARQVIFKLALIISIAITIYRCCRAGKRRQSFRGGGGGNTVRGANNLQNELAVIVVHRGGNSSSASSSSALERVYAHHQQTLPRNQIDRSSDNARFASDNADDQHFPGDQEEEEEEVMVVAAVADSPPTYEEALKSDENQIVVNYQQQQQQKPPPPYSSDL